jgi:hypothetical protein
MGVYVCENPVRAGLVASADEWEWQGEIDLTKARNVAQEEIC